MADWGTKGLRLTIEDTVGPQCLYMALCGEELGQGGQLLQRLDLSLGSKIHRSKTTKDSNLVWTANIYRYTDK